jgi:hypothetical protein
MKKGQIRVNDWYLELQYRNFKKAYRRMNDSFIENIMKFLGGEFERRVMHSAKAIVKGFGSLFI